MLQGVPGALEKQPMLRVHNSGVLRTETEEGGVKQIDVIENRGGFYIGGILQISRIDTGREQSRVTQLCDRFDAIVKIAPEFGDVARAWKTAGHADDRDASEIRARNIGSPNLRILRKVLHDLTSVSLDLRIERRTTRHQRRTAARTALGSTPEILFGFIATGEKCGK